MSRGRQRSCGRAAAPLAAAGLCLALLLVGVPRQSPLSATANTPGSSDAVDTDPAAQPVDGGGQQVLADRVQVLSITQDEGWIELDIAVPATVGALAPVASNFAVTDDGARVSLSVTPVADPTEVILALDTSGSMRGAPLDAARAAASDFVARLPPGTRVGLVGFGQEVSVALAPDEDRSDLIAALAGVEAGGETALWDALVTAADLAGTGGGDRPFVVVLSDGDDTVSRASQAEAVQQLRATSAVLYAVAIESPDTDLEALAQAVGAVGGQFLTTDVDQLDGLYRDIAGRLTNRYRLRFAPVADGRRTVVVSVAVDGAVATAQVVVSGPTGSGPTAAGGPVDDGGGPGSAGEVLGGPGWLASPTLLPIGVGTIFLALLLTGLVLARPSRQIQLQAATRADRLAGFHARLGASLDRLVSRHRLGQQLDASLDAADISLRPGELLVGLAGLALPIVLGSAAVGQPLIGLAIVLVVVLGAVFVIRTKATRRRDHFAEQLTDTLGIMAGSLRAGQSLPRSIEMVATEAPAPTGQEFHRISFEIRVGRDLTESMREASARMRSQDLEWLAQAVDINRELGGDLTEILDNVAGTIRERRTVARQIQALSAEGRATGWMLQSMPIVLFLFSWWRTPEHTATMLEEPTGRVLLGLAVSGLVVGHLWIRRLVKPRF